MTPLGAVLGAFLQVCQCLQGLNWTGFQESHIDMITKDSAVLVLESMAAGTFIYVTFIEVRGGKKGERELRVKKLSNPEIHLVFQVLAQEKGNEHDSLLQLIAIAIGFGVIAILQYSFGHEGHDHGGGHGHHHEEGNVLHQLLTSTLPPT